MSEKRKPLFLLAGHAKGIDPALMAAVAQAHTLKPSVAYIGAASGDNPLFFRWMKSSLLSAGAGRVELIRTTGKKADIPKAIDQLQSCDLIHVGGGDVEVGMHLLEEKNLIDTLKKLFASDKPFSGLSAGSIMLGNKWVKWTDPKDDKSALAFPCLGFAPFACDTHSEDDDFSELRSLVSLCPEGECAYGIPSGAALIVNEDGTLSSVEGSISVFRKTGESVERIADISGAFPIDDLTRFKK